MLSIIELGTQLVDLTSLSRIYLDSLARSRCSRAYVLP